MSDRVHNMGCPTDHDQIDGQAEEERDLRHWAFVVTDDYASRRASYGDVRRVFALLDATRAELKVERALVDVLNGKLDATHTGRCPSCGTTVPGVRLFEAERDAARAALEDCRTANAALADDNNHMRADPVRGHLADADAAGRALVAALDRVQAMAMLLVAGKRVRDFTETIAEADSARTHAPTRWRTGEEPESDVQ